MKPVILHPEMFTLTTGEFRLVWLEEPRPQVWIRYMLDIPRLHGLRLGELPESSLYRYIELRNGDKKRHDGPNSGVTSAEDGSPSPATGKRSPRYSTSRAVVEASRAAGSEGGRASVLARRRAKSKYD